MGGGDSGRTIEVSGVLTDFCLETLQLYFENKKRANGGPIIGEPRRIHNSERVIITFESAKDAENVVQQNLHSISKCEFKVNWCKTEGWQKDAMIVLNVHKDTTEESLIEFLEMKAKLDIVYISLGRISGNFLVYCQNEIEFEYVQKTCTKNCLMGNHLKVDASEEIYSVLVKTNSSKSSSDTLRLYFENKNKSSGGNISSIKELPNNTYIVTFEENSVVLDVCSRQHQLFGAELDAQPFWEQQLEENTISEFPLTSKFLVTFLKEHKSIVNDQLKQWAEVIWNKSKSNKLKLKYTEESFEKVDECLKDLLNSITVEIIDIPANIFKDIIKSFKNKKNLKYIYFDHKNNQANIIGFNKSDVTEKKKIVLNHLTIKHEEKLSIHERCILSGLNFFVKMERLFKGLKISVDADELIYEGCNSQISECQMKVSEIVKSIIKTEVCLPLNAGMIINKEPVKEYLIEKLRNKNCVGSWETGNSDSVLIYASGTTDLSMLEEIMKETFIVNTLNFIEKIEGTSNYKKWLELLENLKVEFPDLYFIGEGSLSFVAVDKVANDIKSKIDNFVESLTYESGISMNHGHFLFVRQFNKEDIKEFCHKSKIAKVSLKENKLYVEGTENQIKQIEIFLEYLRKDINSKVEIFEMFGFGEFLQREEGTNFLTQMQIKTQSIILKSVTESETEEIVNVLYKKCAIVLTEGDITTLNTDAIVNAANGNLKHFGGIAAAIVQKGGYGIQIESNNIILKRQNELNIGDVVSTKPGKLKCKTIIHAVGPMWNNGHYHELDNLSRTVKNCLSFLDKHSYTSIAIPAISTGIYGIPIQEGTKCIVKAIQSYLDNNSNSNIKHICLIDVRKEVIRNFKLHLEKLFKISKTENTSSNTPLPDPQQTSMNPQSGVVSKENAEIEIKLLLDSITNASVDVIINSTSKHLKLESGSISNLILKAAGQQLQDECDQKYPQGISTHTLAVTEGYNLKCKNVFHVVLPSWDNDSSDRILHHLTCLITFCLETAEKMGAKSVAFPILEAGGLKYPLERLPKTMYEAVKKYSLRNESQIKVVNFVILPRDTEVVQEFEEYFEQIKGNEAVISIDKSKVEDNETNSKVDIRDDGAAATANYKVNRVTLKFISKYKNLTNAIETVKEEYNSMLTTGEISLDFDLIEAQKQKIKNIGSKDKIHINISKTITIHGKHSHVKDAKISIQELLFEFKKKEAEALIKGMVQWSYFEINSSENDVIVDEETNAKLEKSFSQKMKTFEWKNIKYDIENMCFQQFGRHYKLKRKQVQKAVVTPTFEQAAFIGIFVHTYIY